MNQADQYTITSKPRHLRLMFFVDKDHPVASLRELIVKNLSFWGGRDNPIIPVSGNMVTPEWRALLSFYNPDYCYFTKGVDLAFLKELCDEYRFNPIEISELDERLLDVKGVHYANLMPLFPKMKLANVYNLSGSESPLTEYYRLNFLVDDTLPVNKVGYSHINNDWLLKNHELSLLNKGNFSSVSSILADSVNITTLSGLNTEERKLRLKNADFHHFELVITEDDKGFDELLYHWNKALYQIPHREIPTAVMTVSELENLLQDKHFYLVLKKMSGQHPLIKIGSFSLTLDRLNEIKNQLSSYTSNNTFELKDITKFPYAILDKAGMTQQPFYEKDTVQVIFKTQPFIFLPPLSFGIEYKAYHQHYGLDIKIAEVLGPHNQTLRFPLKFNTEFMVRTASRVNGNRQISAQIDDAMRAEGKLELNINEFYQVVNISVTAPKITGSRDIKNIYRGISYSDASNRLAHFMKLFKNNFHFLGDFLHDKFWNDLFLDLTDNAKAEGDTITFEEIFERCYTIMIETGQVFTTKEEGRHNIENLKLGVKNMLQTLCNHKVFLPGFVIKCEHCASRVWYSIGETKELITCKGCSGENFFRAENPISYKLNHLVKNNYGMKSAKGNFVPDGNMTAIRTLLHIWNKAANSFQYIPQIDIYDCGDSHKPMTDLDIVAMSAGSFYIGECKHSSDLFFDSGNKSLLNLVKIAADVKPDKVILACTNDKNGKLDKAVKFVRHYMINWKYKPEVIPYITWEPDYFGTNKSSCFYY